MAQLPSTRIFCEKSILGKSAVVMCVGMEIHKMNSIGREEEIDEKGG